jgi:hypothetical protein
MIPPDNIIGRGYLRKVGFLRGALLVYSSGLGLVSKTYALCDLSSMADVKGRVKGRNLKG